MTAKVQSRDKSECLEKRSITARLGDFVKNEKETLSQRDYIEREQIRDQPAVGISDSMEQKTTHTKDSNKQESSLNTTNPNNNLSGISSKNKRSNCTVPKSFVELNASEKDDHNTSRNLKNVRRHASLNSSRLGIQKKLIVKLHTLKIQVSSNIDLKICCQCNDSELISSKIRRVD